VAHFAGFDGTSAATAQAAWMAAQIQAQYPQAWPETVRALLVHSATWTDAMKELFLRGQGKAAFKPLLRTCGYGIPDLNHAIYCMKNSLTLVSQSELQPFNKKANGQYATHDMHLYRLPWPKEVLLGLGEVPVSMRVTLSYFVEPGPGEIGWKDRYRYASHGLRFELNSPAKMNMSFCSASTDSKGARKKGVLERILPTTTGRLVNREMWDRSIPTLERQCGGSVQFEPDRSAPQHWLVAGTSPPEKVE